MKAYFDKVNFESFILQRPKNQTKFERCNDMVKRHLDVLLNMTMEEFQASPLCLSWLTTMTDGAKQFPKPNPEAFNEIFDENNDASLDGFDRHNYSSIYLLDNEKAKSLSKKVTLLVGDEGSEIEILDSLFIDEDTNFVKSLPPRKYFEGSRDWQPLNDYVFPCSDIIIRDAFLLFNNRLHPYTKNIYSLLLKLTQKAKNDKVNIVIVCMKRNTDASQFEPNWDDIRNHIKSLLKSVHNIEANVTYIVADKKENIGHDRTVFTNYVHYMPHDSIGNFYGLNGEYSSKSEQFGLRSIVSKNLYTEAFDFVEIIQGLIYDIMMGKIQGGEVKEDPSGGVLSNYLTFY